MMNKKLVYIICSFAAIAIVGSIFSNNVMADDVDYDVNIAPSILISIPTDTVTLNLNPFVSAFGSTDLPVTVGTNNPTGYTLTMSPSDDTTTSLTRTGGAETIPTLDDLSGGYTEQTFTTNKWGYKLSTTNYLPFATSNEIAVTDTPSNATTSTVTFATKADTTLVSGAYNLEITFTAVANRAPVTWDMAYANAGKTKYNGYYKIQDATSAICTAVDMNEIGEVIDVRDNEVYKVGKLADNKCWMVENLNLAGGTALSATDTDVDSSYISSFTTSNNLTKSGDTIVLPASSTSGFDTANYFYVYNSGNKTNCGASGQETPCYSYYSWDAATLGSGRTISTDNTDAPYSICPKGWRLPKSRTTDATNWQTTSDFYALAHKYGLDSTTSTSESDNGFYTQAGPGTVPNFLLAGSYYSGSFNNGGSNGYLWSATSSSIAGTARYLVFYSSGMGSAGNSGRLYGRSVRCLLAE